MGYIKELADKKIAHPPFWLATNVHYEVAMGSYAYGTSLETSDFDIYAWCIPKREELFRHLQGEIVGFGTQKHRFSQYQEHHLFDPDALGGKGREYDISCYNIIDYFQLVMKNNANVLDSLFVPDNCVLHITRIGQMVREKRKIFLHKGAWHVFKGYSFAQIKKMSNKERESSERQAEIDKHGYDLKYAMHLVRLLNEIEQILTEGDLDLQRNREQLKSIRRGEWTEQQVRDYFTAKEKELEEVYNKSTLPWGPDEPAIKQLLLNCLEEHYGSLSKCIEMPDKYKTALDEIAEVLRKVQN